MIVKLLDMGTTKPKSNSVPVRRDPRAESHRAYIPLELKAFDDTTRSFSGIATTVNVDRYGDIVESEGAIYTLPLPLLWQHDAEQPVGQVTEATVSKNHIKVKGFIANVEEPGTLKDRLDEAYQSLKSQLVRFLSIGFSPKEWNWIDDTYGMHFMIWEWLELSMVTIPANADASITSIKRYDSELRSAASGILPKTFAGVPLVRLPQLGVSGQGGNDRGQRGKGAVRLITPSSN
jgi:HK97 family phage prohead protease